MYKSGFVSIIGKPNAGKSTLLNALLGQKLCIITPKAQTTRHKIMGIDSGEGYQIVYSDTPGVIKPKYKLHEKMMESVGSALAEADVIVVLVSPDEKFNETAIKEMTLSSKVAKILAINKIDVCKKDDIESKKKEWTENIQFDAIMEISALEKSNVEELKSKIIELLPENPPYYDEDSLTDRPERFFVSELIREQIFLNMGDEIPYSSEVVILEFKEKNKMTHIHAEIYVERQSQKGMIIGKQGAMLKKIGTLSRQNIEAFLETKVFLELFVKVRDDWKNNANNLRHFGYQ